MPPHAFFWPPLVYIFAYIYLVDRAVLAVRKHELGSASSEGRIEYLSGGKSVAAVKLMLDSSLPRADFPDSLKRKIVVARFFFYTAPAVCIIFLVLMVFLSK